MQGPQTEPESIAVIRNTLSKGQDCHVKLTNYRKNGEIFQNLLSMKPVFDSDGIYRYVIGVQFEIVEDDNLKQRLVQLDKLLKMLPRTLALKSKPEAQAKGKLATNVNGEANSTIMQKDDILAQKGKRERQNTGDAGDAPVSIMASGRQDTKTIMYDNAVFGMSKLVWKTKPVDSFAQLMEDKKSARLFQKFVETRAHPDSSSTNLMVHSEATSTRRKII